MYTRRFEIHGIYLVRMFVLSMLSAFMALRLDGVSSQFQLKEKTEPQKAAEATRTDTGSVGLKLKLFSGVS